MPSRPSETSEVDRLMEEFQSYLVRRHLKSTRQRDVVARTFFAAAGHSSIEHILAQSRKENPRIGYATVYRTLKLLTECGLADLRRFGEGQSMYETGGDTAHHDHLICVECSFVLEFENEEIEQLQESVARGFGFELVRHRLELYGLCPKARGVRGGACPRDDAAAIVALGDRDLEVPS